MQPHPCKRGKDGAPCKNFQGPTAPWGPDNCYVCWQFANSPKHRALWGGGKLPAARKAACHWKGDTVRENGKAKTREVVTGFG